jgi:hypothetical protein
MEAYYGSWSIAPRILDLATRWRWVVSFTPLPLYPQGRSPWYTLDSRVSGPQSRSGHGVEENSQPPPGIEPRSSHRPAQSWKQKGFKIKLSLCLTKYHTMKKYGGVDVQLHAFLASAVDGSGQLYARQPSVPIGSEAEWAPESVWSWCRKEITVSRFCCIS